MKWESWRLFGFTGWKTLMSSWSEWLTLLKTGPPHSPAASSFHNHNSLRCLFSTWSDLHKAQRVGLRWSVAVKEDFNKRGIYSQMKAGGGFSWCMQSWVFFKSSELYMVVQSFTSREYQNQPAGSAMTLKKSILFGCNFSLTLNKRTQRCSMFHHLCIKEAPSCLGNLLQRLPVPVPPTAKWPPPPNPTPDPLLKFTAGSQYWWHFVKTS